MNCRLCGSPNPDGAESCARCGAVLSSGGPLTAWLFMGRILPALDRGPLLQRLGAVVLQATAAVLALVGAAKWFLTWRDASGMEGGEVVGLIVFQLLTLVMFYALVHACWLRAREVAELPGDEHVALGVAAAWLKLGGEAYAIVAACGGLAMALLVLVSGPSELGRPLLSLLGVFPALPSRGDNPVAGALILLGSFGTAGFVGLLTGHGLARLALLARAAAGRIGDGR
ncbi:MAG: hypothetical protein QM767_05360 [Anaeromyxobacter sp.]